MNKRIFLLAHSKNIKNDKFSNIFSVKHLIFVAALVIGFFVTSVVGSYADKTQGEIASNLLRLHIIANSDSAEDQALKLKVRDAIIKEMTGKFKVSKDIKETKQIAYNNLSNIETIARDVIKQNGKDYDVNVSIGNVYFPTKYYGDIALPPGNYDALRVQIGSAKGANWWCVLFPPLCFVDATNGKLPDSSKEKLKSSLTEEEYNLIANTSRNESVPVKIKFKSVEVWQQSKHKVQVAVGRIF